VDKIASPEISSVKSLAAQRWTDVPERGSARLARVLVWIALHIGRPSARLFLYPITLYFMITAHEARRASYEYLRRMFGSSPHWGRVFKHLHYFAATILDRVFLLRGKFEWFDVAIHGNDVVHRQMENGQGCVLLGSHLGSFEVLRAIGVTQKDLPVKVLMDIDHNQNISRLLDALNPKIAATVIAPDRPDTLLRVKDSLDAGFFIGMLGDRASGNDKTTRCQFLGAPAEVPTGAILLAAMMRCPVVLFFGLYRGGNRYEIFFEHFADEMTLSRDQRTEDIQFWAQRYVERLEHYARLAPYNWFNFYPFWN